MLVDQLLHGYSNGHRLLAASRQPDEGTATALLSHSDSPAAPKGRLLASLPLPAICSWALTSIWPALDAPRPGSVWSHTLLLDEEALEGLRGAGGLLKAFARPSGPDDYSRYSRPLDIVESPTTVPAADSQLTRAIVLAAYGWPEKPTAVLAEDLDEAAEILVAIWQRQWPALRRSFSFRTRQRLSEEARPGVEIARQAARREASERVEVDAKSAIGGADPAWLQVLTGDLQHPEGLVQDFLWNFGPEAPRGRSDLPTLARIYADISDSKAFSKALDDLIKVYPAPDQMAGLKLAMLKPGTSLWRANERVRIELAIANSDAVPWQQLCLSDRTLNLIEEGELEAFAEILEMAASGSRTSAGPGKEILDEVARRNGLTAIRELAGRSPATAARVIRSFPELLEEPQLWKGRPLLGSEFLRELATAKLPIPPHPFLELAVDETIREAIILRLLSAQVVAGFLAEGGAQNEQLARWKAILAEIPGAGTKELVGNAASWKQVALAIAADSKPARAVVKKYAQELAEHFEDMGSDVRLRVAAAIFSVAGGGRIDREAAGRSFAILHRASTKKEVRECLLERLPAFKVSEDALRVALRQALVDIVKEENWGVEDISVALYNAGPGAKKVRDLTPKKSDIRKAFDAAGKLVKGALRAVRGH